jgi:hypothetical protein
MCERHFNLPSLPNSRQKWLSELIDIRDQARRVCTETRVLIERGQLIRARGIQLRTATQAARQDSWLVRVQARSLIEDAHKRRGELESRNGLCTLFGALWCLASLAWLVFMT